MEAIKTQMNMTTEEASIACLEKALHMLVKAKEGIHQQGVAPTGQVKTLTKELKNILKHAKVDILRTSSWENTSNESDSDIDELKIPPVNSEDAPFSTVDEEIPTPLETWDDVDEAVEDDGSVHEDPRDVGYCDQVDSDERLFEDPASTFELAAMYIF